MAAEGLGNLVSIHDLAITFPGLPKNAVDRPHLLDTFDNIFAENINCVFLEGSPEIGKTTLCAQYALRHASASFCLFLGPYRDLSSDPTQLRYDLANQINWFLHGERLPETLEVTLEELRNKLMVLQRRVHDRRTHAYFILDGLEPAAQGDGAALEYLLSSVLPLGSARFRFLLSGSQDLIPPAVSKSVRLKPHTVSPFSQGETAEYLSDLGISPETLTEIHRTTRGVPGRLAAVRRWIESGEQVESVLEGASAVGGEFYASEWRQFDPRDELQKAAVAAIAFLPECRSALILAEIVGSGLHEVRSALGRLTFLSWSPQGTEVWFVSDSFQNHARRKLVDSEAWAVERAISRLHKSGDAREALRLLPHYLVRSRSHDQIQKILGGARIAAAVRSAHALSPAISALDDIRRLRANGAPDSTIASTATMRAALADAMHPSNAESRIKAYVAEGRDEDALSLANAVETDEVRLSLLATLVAEQQAHERIAAEEVTHEISRLISQLDLSGMGDKAIAIAASLISVKPELAAKAVESYAKAEGDSNALDRAFVRLSLKALRDAKGSGDANRVVAAVNKLAKTDGARRFSAQAKIFVDSESADSVLNQIATLSSTSEKLFFIRSWLRANPEKEFACSVAVAASRFILGDAKYASNAKVYRDLATPLLYADKTESAVELFSFLSGQVANAKIAGPVVDYFRLRFRLAIADARWHGEGALADLEEQAFQIDDVPDIGARAACFAWLIRCMEDVGKSVPGSATDDLRVYALKMLSTTIDTLLSGSAEHEEAARGALTAMAPHSMGYAFDLAEKLNTRDRRDDALTLIALRYLDETECVDCREVQGWVQKIIDSIYFRGMRQQVAARFIEWISENLAEVGSGGVAAANGVMGFIYDPDIRLLAISQILGAARGVSGVSIPETMRNEMYDAWEDIEDHSVRLDAGYAAVANCVSPGETEYEELASRVHEFFAIRGAAVERQESWRLLTLLMGRALAGVVAVGAPSSDHVARLLSVAENVSSNVERARILGRSSLHIAEFDRELARRFIGQHVAPNVVEAVGSGRSISSEVERMVVEVAPAMWLFNQASALQLIRSLGESADQYAYCSILDYILKGKIQGEPWVDPERPSRTIKETDVDDVLSILRSVTTDSMLAHQIDSLLDCVSDKNSGARINRTQRGHIAQTIREIADKRFPDPNGISHDGYKVLVDVQLAAFENLRHSDWERLIQRVISIPNLSDKCFVLARTSGLISRRHDALRKRVIESMLDVWSKLPTLEEKLYRLNSLHEYCRMDLGARIKPLIEGCLSKYSSEIDDRGDSRVRALVELAYKVDEEWGASLVSVADEDPARKLLYGDASYRIENLRLAKRLSEAGKGGSFTESASEIASACWRELGQLNGSRSTALDWHDLMNRLAGCPIGSCAESYPVFAFVLAAFAWRYKGSAVMADRATMLSDAIWDAVSVTSSLASRPTEKTRSSELHGIFKDSGQIQLIASAGERERALDAIASWLVRVQPMALEIVDPFLRPEDVVDILSLIARSSPTSTVRILTSGKANLNLWSEGELRLAIEAAWKERNSGRQMPAAVLLVVGRGSSGEIGIHDRWWLSESEGVEFGTSFGSVGIGKVSRVKSLDAASAAQVRRSVSSYMNMFERVYEGERLRYVSVIL